jgi:glycosyltransferase involved in cell wall biosynthesis
MIKRIFIDCTDTYFSGMNTGIQRVVRNFVVHAATLEAAMNVECIPVVFQGGAARRIRGIDDPSLKSATRTIRSALNEGYLSLARALAAAIPIPPFQRFVLAHRKQFGLAWLLFSPFDLAGRVATLKKRDAGTAAGETFGEHDLIFFPDASWSFDMFDAIGAWKANGARIAFLIHDIIPLTHPEFWHPLHSKRFRDWFERAAGAGDFFVYNSHFTQHSVERFWDREHHDGLPVKGAAIHLGYDLPQAVDGLIRHPKLQLAFASSPRSYLCVGTIEPRKNHAVLLDAFDRLWRKGDDSSLIIVGRAGWLCEDTLDRIQKHPRCGERLFWFNDVGDEDLALAYSHAAALIFPSLVEGFGLPLVEALGRNLPVIASDIEVFREVAGDRAVYFPPRDAGTLAEIISTRASEAMRSADGGPPFTWPTWEQSTFEILSSLKEVPAHFGEAASA